MEYVADAHVHSMRTLAAEFSNVLVARTFSKLPNLADLRVGYAMGSVGSVYSSCLADHFTS
jgi:histidinol-phosphate/aromatic aminotransferase/cobyric acid decarboxylase-like protein